MGKYIGGYHTLQPKQDTFGKALQNVSNEMKMASAQKVINDPNSTPIQKAMALASIGQEKLGSDVYKQSAKSANVSTIDQGLQAALDSINRGGGSEAPNIPGATSPIRENTMPDNIGFRPSAPNRAASNAITAQMMQGVDQNYNPYAQQEPQNVTLPDTATQPAQNMPPQAPVVQMSPEEQEIDTLTSEADAYDRAATQYAEVNPTQSRNLKDTANNKRKAVEKIKDRIADKQIANQKEKVRIDKNQEKTYNKIQNEAEHAESHLKSSAQARKAIASGNVGTKGIGGLKRAFFKGSKWEEYFKNEDHALLEAAALEDFSGMKDMFGTRLSDADLKVVSGKVVSPYKSNEANLAIIDYREFQDRMKIAKAEVADQIIEENGGYKPYDFSKQIRQRMGELYGDEADRVLEKALYEGKPSPKPSPQDPTMESVYGKVPQGQIRLKKGSEVITIPAAYLQDALADEYVQLGGAQ